MDHMVDNLKNPFEEVYHWIKGETYDLKALVESIEIKDQVEAQKKKMESRRTNAQNDLQNVNQGKKTVRTIFKNEKDTGGMLSKIENVRQIILLTILVREGH